MSVTESLCMGCMSDNGGEEICPVCGYDSNSSNPSECLPVKYVINDRYVIGKVVSQNGEGISYVGWDNMKNVVISVKEYFPLGCAHRNPDKTVSIVKGKEYPYNEGLLEFIEINRNIMKSELPALVPVIDVFEENGTVFSISKSISGITLRDFLTKNGGTLKWEQARPLFLQLIDTVKGMNDIGIIHRAISVDTVIVGRDGKLRLTDYSVKNLRLTEGEFSSQLFPGFAAIEQYGVMDMHDGAYTDVYGLCATLFYVLVGTVLPEAASRLQSDSMTIPSKLAEELPRHVLSALANGLQVLPKNRTKNIEAFRNELVYGEIAAAPVPASAKKDPEPEKKTQQKKEIKKSNVSSAKYVIISSACTAAVFILIALVLALTVLKDQLFKTTDDPDQVVSTTAPKVESIGSIDSNAGVTAKLYSVPNFYGKYYAAIIEDEDYERFKFVIKDKEYSDKYAKGMVCSQSIPEGASVPKETTIELIISLGPKEVKIANLKGLDETSAKLELLKQGFLYSNIEVIEKYDPESKSGVVIEQEPKYGTSVSADVSVKIYVNTYEE